MAAPTLDPCLLRARAADPSLMARHTWRPTRPSRQRLTPPGRWTGVVVHQSEQAAARPHIHRPGKQGHRCRGFLEDAEIEILCDATLRGNRNERARHHDAVLAGPAGERLKANRFSRGEIHDRRQERLPQLAGHRLADLGFQAVAFTGSQARLRVAETNGTGTGITGHTNRRAGVSCPCQTSDPASMSSAHG